MKKFPKTKRNPGGDSIENRRDDEHGQGAKENIVTWGSFLQEDNTTENTHWGVSDRLSLVGRVEEHVFQQKGLYDSENTTGATLYQGVGVEDRSTTNGKAGFEAQQQPR